MRHLNLGDEFIDTETPFLGVAVITGFYFSYSDGRECYEVQWMGKDIENRIGGRYVNDPSLRELTKLEKVLR